MNRPFSAFGVLLGFLALTMFAVSSTSRSTTVKPAAGHADRAAIRRQASLSRLSAVAAAGEIDSFDEEWLCVPGSIDGPVQTSSREAGDQSQLLRGPTTLRLTPVVVDVARGEFASQELLDGRTSYDPVYDSVVLGIAETKIPAAELPSTDSRRELSAVEVTSLFQSLLPEKSLGARNATRKSQRRAAAQSERHPLTNFLPAFNNWLTHQAQRLSSESSQAAGVEWSEYADLMDRATSLPNTSAVAVRISDAE